MGSVVSAPRRIDCGETVMATKRCVGQEYRLRPDNIVVQIVLYVIGYFVLRYGIDLHEFCVLSNHEHAELTDPQGKRPLFFQQTRALIARAVNAAFGDVDKVYSGQPHSEPVLLDAPTRVEKCLYVLLNPVRHQLVRYAWDWPISSYGLEYDVEYEIPRPKIFFSKRMPETVKLVLRRPPGVRPDLDDRQLRSWIRHEAKRRQGDIAAKLRAEGRSFLGLHRVLRMSRRSHPRDRRIRNGFAPRVAGRDPAARQAHLQRLEKFEQDHEAARLAWLAGDRTHVFPHGTWLARVRYGLPCHPPDQTQPTGPAP